jgi:hypothetical protein
MDGYTRTHAVVARSLIASLLAVMLPGCLASPESEKDIASAFTPSLIDPIPQTDPNPAVGCYVDRYQQPEAVITKKVDLLFLIDTSGSLDDERQQVAQGIQAFVRALPTDVDFRIATMLAHGGRSTHAGRIYSYQRTGTAKVLRSDLLTSAQIQTELYNDLKNVRTDNDTDGGEIGMFSLTRALDDDRLTESRGLGFFRTDAALAVIMVSDENDICSDFPAGVTPVRDPEGSETRAKGLYCTRDAPARIVDGVTITPAYRETITAKSVYTKLQDLQGGRPLVTAAIAYTDRTKIPPVGENEIGYGWLDIVTLGNGVKVEMTDASYETGLNKIGALTTVKLNLQKEFPITRSGFDTGTIDARVDGRSVAFTYIPELNQVSLEELGTARSTIDLEYCDPAPAPSPTPSPTPTSTGVAGVDAICQAGSFIPKGVSRVGLAIDPAEGSMNSIVTGLTSILGAAPTVYTEAEVAGGKLLIDGVTVLALSRKVVITPTTAAFVSGVRDFLAGGGSLVAEYDGAAMLFRNFSAVNVSFTGHFTPSVGLFDGNVAGGGLLMPVTFSAAFVVDSTHPVWLGVPAQLDSGLRAAFAIRDYPADWLHPVATFSASGSTGSIPAGSFPAALVGRCGAGRVVMLPMNHFQVLTNTGVRALVTNAFNWVLGL